MLVFPLVVVRPLNDTCLLIDTRQGEDRLKGWSDGSDQSPLLIIYTRARGALRCTGSHHHKNAIPFIDF